MSEYSLELRYIYEDKNYNLFDFEYNFYDNDFKKQFEEKFFQFYMFNEIGFPTIGMFKQRLKAHLIKIMPYYNQMYKTEIEAKNINFLLNKDLKETFVRELENSINIVSNMDSNSTNINETVNINSDMPQGSIDDINKYMSSASKDNGSTKFNDNSNSNVENTNKGVEKTELISQGNIGITSSAELLEKWRASIINIDELILQDLSILFMQVY